MLPEAWSVLPWCNVLAQSLIQIDYANAGAPVRGHSRVTPHDGRPHARLPHTGPSKAGKRGNEGCWRTSIAFIPNHASNARQTEKEGLQAVSNSCHMIEEALEACPILCFRAK